MPIESGTRRWWPMYMGVNLSNGNLHLELGSGTCVTCGGGTSGSVCISPQTKDLTGPVLIYNTLGTNDSELGPKWMLPWDTYLELDQNDNVTVTDFDGTKRFFEANVPPSPAGYTSDIERDTLEDDGSDFYILTRYNGDKWYYDFNDLFLVKIVSRTEEELVITRDGNGRITEIEDSYGRVIQFFYITFNSITRLNEIREPAPGDVGFYSTFFQYGEDGRLIAITSPIGETTRFEYDGDDRLFKAIDSHGHATTYSYDNDDRVTNIQDPALNNTVFTYAANQTTVTNRINEDTVYDFDNDGRVTKVTDALGNENEFVWDNTTWKLIEEFGPKIPATGTPWERQKFIYTYGNTTATQHELKEREIRKITNTDSTGTFLSSEQWTHNAQHDVLTYTDPLSHTTEYEYQLDGNSDSVGLVKKIINALSETIQENAFDSAANKYRLLTSKNGVNKTWQYAYNQNSPSSFGKPDRVIFPSGAVTNFKIDIRGRTYEITGPSANTDKIVFDALDRQIKHINPDGTSLEWIYDCCHLAADADENEVGSTYEYDVLGRLVKVTNANGEETKYEYNAEGWQTKIIDPRGEETVFSHDAIGRVIQMDYPGGWQEVMTYWEPGMLKTKKNKKGMDETVVEYEYDDLYRLKKKDFPSGTDTELEHYANGLLKKMKDASGEKRYYYDAADRLTKIEQGPIGFAVGTDQNYVLEYVWNAASQLTQMKLTVRTQSMKTWAYTYTDDGYLDVVTNADAEATKHEYLTDGRLKKITVKNNQIGKKETREYFYQDTSDAHAYVSNKNKHLRRTLDKKNDGSTVISEFNYELDRAGIRLSMTDKDEKYNAYNYDPLYQLKAETKWSQKVGGARDYQYAYVFDPNGNRIVEHHDGVVQNFVYGDNNEMLSAGGVDFTYDHFGNTKTKVDGSGTTTYTYDFENHLINVDFPNTANDDTHEYDGVGRRMRSKLNGAGDWTNFIFDELTDNLIAEYTLITGTFTIKSLNTWGIGLISTNREGTKRYFHFDGLGSTAALTDFDMNVTDTYVYSAFGVLESSSGSSVNPFRFVGQWGYYDDGARGSQSGLMFSGNCYYHPMINKLWQSSLITIQSNANRGGILNSDDSTNSECEFGSREEVEKHCKKKGLGYYYYNCGDGTWACGCCDPKSQPEVGPVCKGKPFEGKAKCVGSEPKKQPTLADILKCEECLRKCYKKAGWELLKCLLRCYAGDCKGITGGIKAQINKNLALSIQVIDKQPYIVFTWKVK